MREVSANKAQIETSEKAMTELEDTVDLLQAPAGGRKNWRPPSLKS